MKCIPRARHSTSPLPGGIRYYVCSQTGYTLMLQRLQAVFNESLKEWLSNQTRWGHQENLPEATLALNDKESMVIS